MATTKKSKYFPKGAKVTGERKFKKRYKAIMESSKRKVTL